SASLIASATMIMSSRAYLNASWTKVARSFEPSPCTTAMIATEMPAATRPYSTAVAPDSSFTKRFTRLIIVASTVHKRRYGLRGPLLPGRSSTGTNASWPDLAARLISVVEITVMHPQYSVVNDIFFQLFLG